MLPEIRTSGEIFSIPKFDLDRNDVEGFVDILKGFHAEFRDCFAREEGRENFFYYSIGQFSQLEPKSIEPMALNIEQDVIPIKYIVADSIYGNSPDFFF